jgi:hypothetical protein
VSRSAADDAPLIRASRLSREGAAGRGEYRLVEYLRGPDCTVGTPKGRQTYDDRAVYLVSRTRLTVARLGACHQVQAPMPLTAEQSRALVDAIASAASLDALVELQRLARREHLLDPSGGLLEMLFAVRHETLTRTRSARGQIA